MFQLGPLRRNTGLRFSEWGLALMRDRCLQRQRLELYKVQECHVSREQEKHKHSQHTGCWELGGWGLERGERRFWNSDKQSIGNIQWGFRKLLANLSQASLKNAIIYVISSVSMHMPFTLDIFAQVPPMKNEPNFNHSRHLGGNRAILISGKMKTQQCWKLFDKKGPATMFLANLNDSHS